MRTFIQTIQGADQPGTIAKIAITTRGCGAQWETSKAIKFSGQFIAMMKVKVPSENEQQLKEQLQSEFSDLLFTFSEEVNIKHGRAFEVEINCPDRPGLTREITHTIEDLSVMINQFDFNRYSVPEINDTVFSAKLSLETNEDVQPQHIADELEALDPKLRVTI